MAERIISLLPSATEVLWFLGHGERVVGVTFECHYPPEAAGLPQITDTIVPQGSTPAEIDRILNEAVSNGTELYRLDRELLTTLKPDLIVSQDLCRVCALPSGDVNDALEDLGCESAVFSYDPMTLDAVFEEMSKLHHVIANEGSTGQSTDGNDSARGIQEPAQIAGLRERLEATRKRVENRDRPRVLLLEWPDPPFGPGHWIPDQIVAAGGEPLLAAPGGRSSELGWEAVAESNPDVLIVAPCGFDAQAAEDQLGEVLKRPEIASSPAARNGRAYSVDGDAYIVRPGPRLVEGVEVLASLFHPQK